MDEIVALKVFKGEEAEDVVEDGCGLLDIGVVDNAAGLEAGEGKFLNELLQRNSILQADGYGYGEAIEKATHGGSFLGHVYKYLTEGTVVVLTCSEEYGLTAHLALEGVATALGRELLTLDYAAEAALEGGIGAGLDAFVDLVEEFFDGKGRGFERFLRSVGGECLSLIGILFFNLFVRFVA